MLYRLSLVLDLLDLGVGQTVLDFGAGSCWLSACLNRLRCHTVSVDVSPTALALGREAFALDPRQVKDLDARFVAYDGLTLPLEAESVDRAVCFDSFHHVPNQDAVLGELHRVLRPGGRVVLAEPGEGHAKAEHSRFETSHFGVLENELDLGDLLDRARRAGFDRFLAKPYPDAPAITIEGEDCLWLMDGDHSLFPMHLLEKSLRSFYLVALLKGKPRIDSRNPHELRARIQPAPGARLAGKAGEVVPLLPGACWRAITPGCRCRGRWIRARRSRSRPRSRAHRRAAASVSCSSSWPSTSAGSSTTARPASPSTSRPAEATPAPPVSHCQA